MLAEQNTVRRLLCTVHSELNGSVVASRRRTAERMQKVLSVLSGSCMHERQFLRASVLILYSAADHKDDWAGQMRQIHWRNWHLERKHKSDTMAIGMYANVLLPPQQKNQTYARQILPTETTDKSNVHTAQKWNDVFHT